ADEALPTHAAERIPNRNKFCAGLFHRSQPPAGALAPCFVPSGFRRSQRKRARYALPLTARVSPGSLENTLGGGRTFRQRPIVADHGQRTSGRFLLGRRQDVGRRPETCFERPRIGFGEASLPHFLRRLPEIVVKRT